MKLLFLTTSITLVTLIISINQVHGLADPVTAQPSAVGLTFEVGGAELRPQDLPDFLHPYHTKSLELTESTLSNRALTCARAVRYGPEEHQLLDVWSASSPGDDEAPTSAGRGAARPAVPVVVFLHGGGWDWGYREWVGFCARNVCRDGRAVMVAPSYAIGRGAAQAWPASRDDVTDVLRWVSDADNDGETTVASRGGDPSKIILAGHSAGGHLAACVGLDRELLEGAGLDPDVVRALFLISCPLGIRAEDFFSSLSKRKWLWKVVGPAAKFLYKRAFLKFLKPVVGSAGKGEGQTTRASVRRAAEDASPLFRLAVLREKDKRNGGRQQLSYPFVHYSYAAEKDFPICRPHAQSLSDVLGEDNVEVLEMPVEGHFESHFSLDDPSNEWHDALQKTLSSM